MHYDIQPGRPHDWGSNRTHGQWVHSGAGSFNPGTYNLGVKETILTRAGVTPGRWDIQTTLRSYPTKYGTEPVLERGDHHGIPTIKASLLFNGHATYQHTSAPVNLTVTPPDSHYPLWDGIRHQLDLGPVGSIGPGATPWIIAMAFVAPPRTADQRTFGWSLHDPGVYKSSPIQTTLRNGKLYVGGKYSPLPVVNNDRNINKSWEHLLLDLGDEVGTMVSLVFEVLIDPGPDGRGYLKVHRVHPDRVEPLVDIAHRFGWIYKPDLKRNGSPLNDLFRIQAFKSYNYLRWAIPKRPGESGDWRKTGIPNWAGPEVKTNEFGRFVVSADGDLSFADAVEIARSQLPGSGAKPPTPVPVPPVPPVPGDLTELRAEVALLRAKVAEHEKRWAAVKQAVNQGGTP